MTAKRSFWAIPGPVLADCGQAAFGRKLREADAHRMPVGHDWHRPVTETSCASFNLRKVNAPINRAAPGIGNGKSSASANAGMLPAISKVKGSGIANTNCSMVGSTANPERERARH
ncbi:hypothetical protein [Sphingopyxis sp. 22461]|uniref:hypothetical protein n=1 Tax=Sphingopyxis sp. 22461 TaxID=3453923 RepID=UPI003F84A6AB